MTEFADYAALVARAETGALRPVPDSVLRGPEAAEAGRAALLAATGATSLDEATQLAVGRPRLGQDRRPSAVWKVRASADLDDLVTSHARRHGISLSALIREAVNEYVLTHS